MSVIRLRPTFQIRVAEPRGSALEKLEIDYRRRPRSREYLLFGEYGELHLPPTVHRLWSPHLSFYLWDSHQQTHLFGRFAPRIEVWTLVWIFYLGLAFNIFFGITIGITQWVLGESIWGLWVAGASALALVVLYGVADWGQRRSSDQMQLLRHQLEEILDAAGVEWLPEGERAQSP